MDSLSRTEEGRARRLSQPPLLDELPAAQQLVESPARIWCEFDRSGLRCSLYGTVRGCPSDSNSLATSVDGYTFFTAIGADGHLYYKARGNGTWQSAWQDRGTVGGLDLP